MIFLKGNSVYHRGHILLWGTREICDGGGMAKITGFHHTAITTRDFEASVKFYTETLGMKTKITWGKSPDRAIMIDAGDGNYVEIFERADASPKDGTVIHFALRTDDCTAMTERVRAAGMEITVETKDVTIDANVGPVPVRISFFKGPSGEVVELFENRIL